MPTMNAITAREHRYVTWFFLIALLVLAAGYGLRDPWPADEPRFVLVAKQMVESGDWLFPHRGSELYPDKPPLYFWLLGACYWVIGNWRWSFLLPSLLSGLGTLWLSMDLGRRLWNPRAGLWAAVAVLSSLQFVYQFKRAQIDPTLVFLTTLSLYGLCRHLLLGPHWRWFWLGCFSAGLGVIAKGVGFLPLLALLPFTLMTRMKWQGLTTMPPGSRSHWALGTLAFVAAMALWFAPMLWVALSRGDAEHAAYLQNILFRQTAERFANPWHHHEPFWYYLEVVGLFWLPFSLALFWLLKPWAQAWRERDARIWLPLTWALLVLALFSSSSGKRDMYILPALPALALAAAPFLDGIAARAGFRRALCLFVIALGALLFGLGVSALVAHPKFVANLESERGVGEQLRWLWWMLTVVGGLSLLGGMWWRTRGALQACALALVLVWCGYGFVVHPTLDASSSARGLMQQARKLAGPAVVIGLVDWKEQNLLQAVGPTAEFGFSQPPGVQLARAAAWQRRASGTRLLLVQRSGASKCLNFEGPQAWRVATANRRDWWLLGPLATSRCPNSRNSVGNR